MSRKAAENKSLRIKEIRTDGGTQSRATLDRGHVDDMLAFLNEDASNELPPVKVAEDENGVLWLYGGFHRIAAYQQAGRKTIRAEVRAGTQRDAILWSLGENATHGLKRTNADKRNAVETALADSEWSKLSNRQIAKLCAVSSTFVDAVRAGAGANVCGRNSLDHAVSGVPGGTPETVTGRDGKQYQASHPPSSDFTDEEIAEAEEFVAKNGKAHAPAAEFDDPDETESAEPPAEPEVPTDAEGEPIPAHALEAFAKAKELAALCREIDGIILRVEQLAKGPGGRLIRFDSFRQQMKDAKGNLWANRATHVCPYCHGKQKKCDGCKGEGWVAKHIWQQAPGTNGKESVA